MRTNFHPSLTILSGVTTLALAAASAFAAPPGPQPQDPMTKDQPMTTPAMDTKTTTAQVKCDALDVNHDGFIDKLEAAVSRPLQQEFAKLDANGDGKLSLVEFENVKDLASIKTPKESGY